MSSSGAVKWMEPEEAHAGEVRKLSTLLEASQALSATLDLKEGLRGFSDPGATTGRFEAPWSC
jgi:hypothetical protein